MKINSMKVIQIWVLMEGLVGFMKMQKSDKKDKLN
jgi:hypothetical protein